MKLWLKAAIDWLHCVNKFNQGPILTVFWLDDYAKSSLIGLVVTSQMFNQRFIFNIMINENKHLEPG